MHLRIASLVVIFLFLAAAFDTGRPGQASIVPGDAHSHLQTSARFFPISLCWRGQILRDIYLAARVAAAGPNLVYLPEMFAVLAG